MIESISKLDAARRQLDLAVLLYFRDDDPLGVHTLAGAAEGLLRDLLIKRGGERKAPPNEFLDRMIREAKNFLKHADRDAGDVLKFNPDWTDFLVFEAIRMYIDVAGTLSVPAGLFLLWLSVKYPNVRLLDGTFLGGSALDEAKRLVPAIEERTRKAPFLRVLEDRRRADGPTPPSS